MLFYRLGAGGRGCACNFICKLQHALQEACAIGKGRARQHCWLSTSTESALQHVPRSPTPIIFEKELVNLL